MARYCSSISATVDASDWIQMCLVQNVFINGRRLSLGFALFFISSFRPLLYSSTLLGSSSVSWARTGYLKMKPVLHMILNLCVLNVMVSANMQFHVLGGVHRLLNRGHSKYALSCGIWLCNLTRTSENYILLQHCEYAYGISTEIPLKHQHRLWI